jgi:translocation and assembly module TamA
VRDGENLDAASILAVQQDLFTAVQKDHCYFSLDIKNSVTLDPQSHTGKLVYNINAGDEGYFGPVNFTGQSSVKTSYLEKLIPWKEGECYRQDKIEQLKTSLLETGLFSRAEAILPAAPADDGRVAVEIQVTEHAQRTIKTGLSYYTDEGPGAILGWEHRNFFGAAEKLAAELTLSSIKQNIALTLTKPFFLRKDQSLSLNSNLGRQDTDAYEEFGANIGASLNRQFNPHLSGSAGVALTLTETTEKNNLNNDGTLYGLVSLPGSLTFDNRNNKLDSSKGWLITGSLTPFLDVLGHSDPFLKAHAGASTYYALDEDADYIFAMRAGFGSILGSGVFDVPPTERFYAGGGGSVRGFGYQEIGPKDSAGNPLGGRSIATASTELRVKFTDTIGGVAFVDAGSVSEESYADMKDIAVGAGIGLRYYTGFGPLRFDLATPLTQKEDLDQNYQIYISIGQAF